MVVSFVIIGEIGLMLICSAGSRGVRLGPQNVEVRWRTPSVRTMLALRTMRILAAKMRSPFCGPIILRGSAQLPLEARSSYLVQRLVQHREFFGTYAIVKQVRSSQTRRLSQRLDLQIN